MKHPILIPAAAVALGTGALGAQPAMAADSIADGSEALAHLGDAAGLLAESGFKTAAAASVLPATVLAVGAVSVAVPVLAVGAVAAEAADESARASQLGPAPPRPRLVVSRQIIVAQPAPQVPYEAQPQREPRQ